MPEDQPPRLPFFFYISFFSNLQVLSPADLDETYEPWAIFFTRPPLPWDENNSWRLVSSWTSALRLRGPSARCVDWQIAHTTCCVTPSCPLWYIARVKYHSEGSPGIKSTFKNLLHAPFISILWLFMGYCHAGMVCAVLWKKFCKRNTLFKKKKRHWPRLRNQPSRTLDVLKSFALELQFERRLKDMTEKWQKYCDYTCIDAFLSHLELRKTSVS